MNDLQDSFNARLWTKLMEFYSNMKSHGYLIDLILIIYYHESLLFQLIDLKIQEIDYVGAIMVHHR